MNATDHTLLATFRARRDAALARRHDELAVFWGQQSLALVRQLDDGSSSLPVGVSPAHEAYALATAVLNLHQPVRAAQLVYPFMDKSLACRLLYTQACLIAGDPANVVDALTDPAMYQELTVLVDPVPLLPGEVDRVARMWTLRGGWYVQQAKMGLAKQCFFHALQRDPGAWDAMRALVEFKLLTPDEEVRLVTNLDMGGLAVGLPPVGTAVTTRTTRRGGGSSSTSSAASASAVESTRQAVGDALSCLASALVASASPTLSPSTTVFQSSPDAPPTSSTSPAPLDHVLKRLATTYPLGHSPTTLLAQSALLLHSPCSSPSSLAMADRTLTKVIQSIDSQSPTAIIALLDTLRTRHDVLKLRAMAEDLSQSLPGDLGALLLASHMAHDPPGMTTRLTHLVQDAAAAAATAIGAVVPGTATVDKHVLASYAIASYHTAGAQVADDDNSNDNEPTLLTNTRAAAPWNAYLPAIRALHVTLQLDDTFVPAVLLLGIVVAHVARLANPVADATAAAGADLAGLQVHQLLDDAHDTLLRAAQTWVPHAPEPRVALARVCRAMGRVDDARRWYDQARERLQAAGRKGAVEEVMVRGELGCLLAENHALNEGMQLLQDAVTHLRGKVHPSVRAPFVTALVQAIVSMVSQFDDPSTLTATSELRKAHALVLDALAATRPARRFPLYTLQAHVCELLGDSAGAVTAYHAALRLVPNDPACVRKLHAVAVANVAHIAKRVAERAAAATHERPARVREPLGRVDDEDEHDELIPRQTRAAPSGLDGVSRARKRRLDPDMAEGEDDEDNLPDDFMLTDDGGGDGDDGGCVPVHRLVREALMAGMAMDAQAGTTAAAAAVHMADTASAAGREASPWLSAADLDEPTEVISRIAPTSRRQEPSAPAGPVTRRGGASAESGLLPSRVAVPARTQRVRPQVGEAGGRNDGRVNLMGRFGQHRQRAQDDPSVTSTGAYPTDSAVGGLTRTGRVDVGASAGRPRTRSTGYQVHGTDEDEDEHEHVDPDSSIDHNSPTVRIAAAAGGPTTRAAARRQQQAAAAGDFTSPSATITPSRGRGGRGRGMGASAAARGARR